MEHSALNSVPGGSTDDGPTVLAAAVARELSFEGKTKGVRCITKGRVRAVVRSVVVLFHVLGCCNPHATENTSAGQLSLGITARQESFPVSKLRMEGRLCNEGCIGFTGSRVLLRICTGTRQLRLRRLFGSRCAGLLAWHVAVAGVRRVQQKTGAT